MLAEAAVALWVTASKGYQVYAKVEPLSSASSALLVCRPEILERQRRRYQDVFPDRRVSVWCERSSRAAWPDVGDQEAFVREFRCAAVDPVTGLCRDAAGK